jgi:ATP-dependent Clp endopeptidase proteolytic subunit ClpP
VFVNSWYALAKKTDIGQTEISIYDEIGAFGVSAKSFLADLQRIPADHTILLKIHSPGGEVFDGNAIFNSLKRRAADVVVQIEGIAASMATVISLAGHHVKMAANGFYMIHNPWGMAMGDAAELRDQAELLDKIRSNMVGAYAAKSGQSPEQIKEWMDAETWFTAEQALAAGFVDEITDGLAIAASANRPALLTKFRNTPAALLTPEPPRMNETQPVAEPEVEILETEKVENEPNPLLVEILASLDEVETKSADLDDESKVTLSERLQSMASAMSAPEEETTEEVTKKEDEEYASEPQAKIAAADQILAKYNAALAERDSALAEARSYKAQLDTEREALQRLERSLGLSAARVVPVIENASPEASDPVAEYIAAVEAGDRKTASALFEKHKAAIWQHRSKISKA